MSKKPNPIFRADLPHGEVYSSANASSGEPATRFIQNGHRFAANRDYLGPEVGSVNTAVSEEVAVIEDPATRVALLDSEVDDLLAREGGKELLDLPLDRLAAAVADAGGPAFSGDNAHKFYAAWLIKAQ